jgi:hypothetical protein
MDDGFGQQACELSTGSDSAGSDATSTASSSASDPSTTSAGSMSASGDTSVTDTDTESDTMRVTASDTESGTDSLGTESAGTESAGTESAGTESAGTESSGTESAGTESAGTESAGTAGSDGTTTTGATELYCVDADGDGYGDPTQCAQADPNDPPPGTVPAANGFDCDDDDDDTFPGAAPNDDPQACMTDADGDGYGDASPNPGVTPGTDCNDANPDAWRCVVLVTLDGTVDNAYDEQIMDILESHPYEVTVIEDDQATAADGDGANLVVISETAFSLDIGGTFRDVEAAVICMEGLVWDDMDMAPEASSSALGSGVITDPNSPLSGGLSGTVSLVEGVGSGTLYTVPAVAAERFVVRTVNPNQVIGFAFEAGATMENGFSAPARRVGLGFDHDRVQPSSTLMTAAGEALFEASVLWSMP